jgi:hypothetical protein
MALTLPLTLLTYLQFGGEWAFGNTKCVLPGVVELK